MAKRIRLRDIIAGAGLKEINATILSGDIATLLSGNPTESYSDLYVAGQSGNLLLSPAVSADSVLYNIRYFDRMYSVQNPEIYGTGTDLNVMASDADFIDSVQFGDYAFLLTNATSLGTKYNLSSSIEVDDSSWYNEPHQVVTYVPGTSGDQIDKIIKNMTFSITEENNILFGIISGSSLIVYVKDLSGSYEDANTVYTMSGGLPNSLPFNYLMEQPLNYSVRFNRGGSVFGDLSGTTTIVYTPDVTLSGEILYSPYANDDSSNKIYVNPFALKNMYDYNWQTNIDHTREILEGIRDYIRVGKTQNTLWLAYKYYDENSSIVQNYELVERVRGLYKFKVIDGHKSNIYSIKIRNSGLNESIKDSDIKMKIRNIITETVHRAVKKIAPAHTQLWKIQFEGL